MDLDPRPLQQLGTPPVTSPGHAAAATCAGSGTAAAAGQAGSPTADSGNGGSNSAAATASIQVDGSPGQLQSMPAPISCHQRQRDSSLRAAVMSPSAMAAAAAMAALKHSSWQQSLKGQTPAAGKTIASSSRHKVQPAGHDSAAHPGKPPAACGAYKHRQPQSTPPCTAAASPAPASPGPQPPAPSDDTHRPSLPQSPFIKSTLCPVVTTPPEGTANAACAPASNPLLPRSASVHSAGSLQPLQQQYAQQQRTSLGDHSGEGAVLRGRVIACVQPLGPAAVVSTAAGAQPVANLKRAADAHQLAAPPVDKRVR